MKTRQITAIILILIGIAAYLPVLSAVYNALTKIVPLIFIGLGIWMLVK